MASSYRCQKCRVVLFTDADLIPHSESTDGGDASWRFRGKIAPATAIVTGQVASTACSVHNLDPAKCVWLQPELEHGATQGKITCTGTLRSGQPCNNKLGDYNWPGTTCTCGIWVAPAFLVTKSRVDRIAAPPSATAPTSVTTPTSTAN
ncbi:hypothetical protein BC828DRAFT_385373 [Blastocladiella britannica]|nr:hypothetical protein BC828DRAFT_385373 [Blastocladiella britannica]